MKIYFVRHGQTDWNVARRLQGRTNIPLNENGILTAELTREGLKDVKFDAAFTSPLDRAKRTAQIILEGRDIEIVEDPHLMEINFGSYEGINRFEAGKNIENFFGQSELYHAEGNAESIEELFERVGGFLDELIHNERYQDSTILVSTHGAALNGIISVIKGYSVGELWKDGLHKNCGVTIVEVQDGKPVILQQAVIFYEE